jgi:hypothetical protein
MKKISNGEAGVDLEHVLFMPMEPFLEPTSFGELSLLHEPKESRR